MEARTRPDWRSGDRAAFYESILDSLKNPVVFCDLEDVMQYMNAAAEREYHDRGGRSLLGRSVLECHNRESSRMITEIKERFRAEPDLDEVLITDNEKYRIWMRAVREDGRLTGYYERYAPPKGS